MKNNVIFRIIRHRASARRGVSRSGSLSSSRLLVSSRLRLSFRLAFACRLVIWLLFGVPPGLASLGVAGHGDA